MLVLGIIAWLLVKFYHLSCKPIKHSILFRLQPLGIKILTALKIFAMYFLGMRGNLGIVPLSGRHTTISENAFINILPLNGLFSVKIAWSDRKNSRIDTNFTKTLKSTVLIRLNKPPLYSIIKSLKRYLPKPFTPVQLQIHF